MPSRTKQQSVTRRSSDVRTNWSDIVATANSFGEVIVTNDDQPEVVVVSMERFAKLKQDAAPHDPLAALRAEFDRELASLRAPDASQKLRKAFASKPAEIAKAANAAARRKR